MKPSEMTDQELVRAWFVEVHGWQPASREWLDVFPDILDSESAFNEHVLPVMEERGLLLRIDEAWAHWVDAPPFSQATVTITKNRRLRAAVEGALEIWREKNE